MSKKRQSKTDNIIVLKSRNNMRVKVDDHLDKEFLKLADDFVVKSRYDLEHNTEIRKGKWVWKKSFKH